MRRSRKTVLQEFCQKLLSKASLFAFSNIANIVPYSKTPGKNVLLLIIMPQLQWNLIDIGDEKKRPSIIKIYNKTKDAIDNTDCQNNTYSVARITLDGHWRYFSGMMNLAIINSFIIYTKNTKTKITPKQYILDLFYDLVREHIMKNRTKKHIHLPTKQQINELFQSSEQEQSNRPRIRTWARLLLLLLLPTEEHENRQTDDDDQGYCNLHVLNLNIRYKKCH